MNYYDENAQEFFDGTVDADMSSHHEKFLKLMPKTIFLNATNDPLRDDTIRLVRKIAKIPGLDVKDYELQNYQHGFMGAEDANISGLPRRLVSKFINDFLNDN